MTEVISAPCALVAGCMHCASSGDSPTINHAPRERGVSEMKLLNIVVAAAVIMTAPLTVYPSCGIVTEIEGDVVIYTESNGNSFSFLGAEDWMVGDIVAVIMSDCGTPEVTDDMVIQTQYCGYAGKEIECH